MSLVNCHCGWCLEFSLKSRSSSGSFFLVSTVLIFPYLLRTASFRQPASQPVGLNLLGCRGCSMYNNHVLIARVLLPRVRFLLEYSGLVQFQVPVEMILGKWKTQAERAQRGALNWWTMYYAGMPSVLNKAKSNRNLHGIPEIERSGRRRTRSSSFFYFQKPLFLVYSFSTACWLAGWLYSEYFTKDLAQFTRSEYLQMWIGHHPHHHHHH